LIRELLDYRESNFESGIILSTGLERLLSSPDLATLKSQDREKAGEIAKSYHSRLAALQGAKEEVLALLDEDQGEHSWESIRDILDAPEVNDKELYGELTTLMMKNYGERILNRLN